MTVGFGARNFADLDRGLREMARVTRPGGRVVVLEITTPQRPPLSWFFRLWFDRAVPALGRLAGEPDAYSYLPSSVRRFPGPEELARRMGAAGLERRALDPHGGRDHRPARGNAPRMNTAQAQLGAVLAAGGPELSRLLRAHGGAAGRGGRGPRRGARRACVGHARRRRQAPAAGARLPVRRRATATVAWSRPRRPSSCCTWPRSCTTTCSTAPSCAAAGRPCSPRAAAWRRPRPATCSSRAPSPSWSRPAARRPCARCRRPRPRSRAAS